MAGPDISAQLASMAQRRRLLEQGARDVESIRLERADLQARRDASAATGNMVAVADMDRQIEDATLHWRTGRASATCCLATSPTSRTNW